jgi:single-strand DNA-binding protein
MSNETWVTVFGVVVADDPSQRSALAPVKFRMGSTPSWRGDDGLWRDGDPNYFDVACWEKLGQHVLECVRRGDPVMVYGKLSIRDWETEKGRGRSVEINAQHVGVDLKLRKAYSQRPVRTVPALEETQVTAPEADVEAVATLAEPAA